MNEQSIRSEDMSIKRLFQDFYREPDYQREYVWGEKDPKGERGDEVDQFLDDIHTEFQGGRSPGIHRPGFFFNDSRDLAAVERSYYIPSRPPNGFGGSVLGIS
jgi:hypothetical protein